MTAQRDELTTEIMTGAADQVETERQRRAEALADLIVSGDLDLPGAVNALAEAEIAGWSADDATAATFGG